VQHAARPRMDRKKIISHRVETWETSALLLGLIHRSAWKGNSANFVLMHIMLGTVALMVALSGTGS
jgi:hypothetical protein